MHYKLTRLLLLPTAHKPNTTAEAFIANPPIDQESLLGKLFFVAEIESNKPVARKALDYLAESLSTHYYQAEKISMREKMGTLNVADIFETALAKVNADFELFTKRERIKIAPKHFAITAGVIHNTTLVFSAAGTIAATLLYPDRTNAEEGKKKYKITPINDSEAGDRKVRLEKLFGSITEGKLPAEGYVVLSNEILPEYITNRHLSKIITTLPPQSAVEQIKNQLHKINNHVTFVALIIKNSKTPHVQRTIPNLNVNVTAHNSLERMHETEHATERYLSPAGAGGTFGWSRITDIVKSILPNRTPRMNAVIRDKLFFAKKNRSKVMGNVQQAFAVAAGALATALQKTWRALSDPRRTWERCKTGLRRSAQIALHSGYWFMKLPRLHKGLLAVFALAIVLFALNIYQHNTGELTAANQEQYQAALQELQQQHNQIRASLLYRNDAGARALLGDAQDTLATLIAIAGERAPVVETLRNEQQEYIDQLSNVTVVTNPNTVATVFAEATHLALANGAIVAFAPGNTTIAGATANGSAFSATLPEPAISGTTITADEAVVFSGATGALIDASGNVADAAGTFQRVNERIIASGSYNGRLYTLDAGQDELWRYAINFNSKQAWLKEDMALDSATDIAIDGYIYLGFTDGRIRRFLSGYENEFEPAETMPTLAAVDALIITGDSENGFLYVLERTRNRIIVFDKTGAFIAQYRFESLSAIADFAITSDDTRGYVLSEGTIYTFPLQAVE
jgi:hypothetical protein